MALADTGRIGTLLRILDIGLWRTEMSQASIFLGVTTAPCRDQVAKYALATKAERLIHPCAGRFSVVESCIKHGARATQVEASDIGLFSSMIGMLAAGKHPQEITGELSIRIQYEPFLLHSDLKFEDPLDELADVMMLLKYGQFKPSRR